MLNDTFCVHRGQGAGVLRCAYLSRLRRRFRRLDRISDAFDCIGSFVRLAEWQRPMTPEQGLELAEMRFDAFFAMISSPSRQLIAQHAARKAVGQ